MLASNIKQHERLRSGMRGQCSHCGCVCQGILPWHGPPALTMPTAASILRRLAWPLPSEAYRYDWHGMIDADCCTHLRTLS